MARFVVALSLTLLITSFVGAQPPNPTPVKNATALAEIEAAITAMGGDAAVLQISDSVITGTITPTTGSWLKPATFVWKTSGAEFRYEIQRDSGNQIFVSGYGKPAVSRNGKVTPLFYHMAQAARPFALPAIVLLASLTDPEESLVDAGQMLVSGKAASAVRISSTEPDPVAAITLQTWYFDAATSLPLRVEYRLPGATDVTHWANAALDFADFRKAGLVTVPFDVTYSEEGVALETFSVATVDFNVGVSPSEFDLSGGGK